MTAITLNLLAEEHAAQEQRAHDPIKAAIAVAAGLIALVVGVGAMTSVFASQKKNEVAALQEQYKKLNSPQLQEKEATFALLKKTTAEVMLINQSRYLFAPRLALVKDLLPDNVQLNRMSFAVTTETLQPESESAAPADGAPVKAARPKTVERMGLRLEGKVVSNRPELDVDAFIKTLRANADFSADIDQIQLRSVTRAAGEAATGPSADFVVECFYKERK